MNISYCDSLDNSTENRAMFLQKETFKYQYMSEYSLLWLITQLYGKYSDVFAEK